jgi:hypothetical protein
MSNSNLFEEIMDDANAVQEKLLGPTYPYYNNIKTPKDIGMSSKGSISAVSKDINGLISYVEVLVTGKSKASKSGKPLGNKFFLKTGAKCKDISNDASNNELVDRYIYVDNVPAGNIPFISQGLGVNFSEFKGLIPGAMGNLNVLNPFSIMQSFLSGGTPDCQSLTMQTIDNKNHKSSETHYVTTLDIKNMDPCIFSDGKNPVSKKKCKETFENEENNNDEIFMLPNDPLAQIYYFSLALIAIYILSKLMEKSRY